MGLALAALVQGGIQWLSGGNARTPVYYWAAVIQEGVLIFILACLG